MDFSLNEVTKRARVEGNFDAFSPAYGTSAPLSSPITPESRTEFHTGADEANPTASVKHMVPLHGDSSWVSMVTLNTPVLHRSDAETLFDPESSIFARDNVVGSIAYDVIQLNSVLADEFIERMNILAKDVNHRGKQLVQLFDAKIELCNIFKQWRLGGVNITVAPTAPEYGLGFNPAERCVEARVRGIQLCKNYWEQPIHGGYSLFFVAKFVELCHNKATFKLQNGNTKTSIEFDPAFIKGKRFIPQLVAMYHIDSFLPLEDLKFTLPDPKDLSKEKVYLGTPMYLGQCFYNPGFARSESDEERKNIPMASATIVDSRFALSLHSLMY